MKKLVEVKYFEPEKKARNRNSLVSYSLSDRYYHPARYRYSKCWMEYQNDVPYCCEVGREGWWPFPNNVCENFLGEFRAEITQEIDEARAIEADRFELA